MIIPPTWVAHSSQVMLRAIGISAMVAALKSHATIAREETVNGQGETESHEEIHPMDGGGSEFERHAPHGFHDVKTRLRGRPEALKSYSVP